MEEMYEGTPVFCYAYRPMMCSYGPDDGGFAVNVMDNGLVIYTQRNAAGRIVEEYGVQIPTEAVNRCCVAMARGRRWLDSNPYHMAEGQTPAFSSLVGINGYPVIFQLDDLPRLINTSFGSQRGYYARQMYNLLEEVTGLLRPYGVYLDLTRYYVDRRYVRVVPHPRRRRMLG